VVDTYIFKLLLIHRHAHGIDGIPDADEVDGNFPAIHVFATVSLPESIR
jgi:hypothetical protein